MDLITIYIIAWFGLVVFMGVKTLLDQYALLKLYRKILNPPYPIVPGEKAEKSDPLGITVSTRWLRITFGKHQDHPEIARLAKKTRMEFMSVFIAMIGGFALFGLLVFLSVRGS